MTVLSNIINKQFNLFDRGTDILEKIVSDYPASSLARLILLRKYKETDNSQYQKLQSEFALYMDSIPWYLFVLSLVGEPEVSENEGEQHIIVEQPADISSLAAESSPAKAKEDIPPHPVVEIVEEEKSPDNLEFEPLYTIDYFASQGIILNEEALKNDKLYQQVRSFTGWLKSMKKLHPGRLPEQNEVIERIIQNASERSNVGADVLTEAMAEVLVKQNKKEKAIEMYEKLSLMNPSKSAYFAAKIENLKTA